MSLDHRPTQFHAIVIDESSDFEIEITARLYLFSSQDPCLSGANQKYGAPFLSGSRSRSRSRFRSLVPPLVGFIDCAAQYSQSESSAKASTESKKATETERAKLDRTQITPPAAPLQPAANLRRHKK